MPWQATFTLGRHSKGYGLLLCHIAQRLCLPVGIRCHLITEEVNKHIAEGLKQTPVGSRLSYIEHLFPFYHLSYTDRNSSPIYVRY